MAYPSPSTDKGVKTEIYRKGSSQQTMPSQWRKYSQSLRRTLVPDALRDKTLAQASLIIQRINGDGDGRMSSKAESVSGPTGTVPPGNSALYVQLSSWAKEELSGFDFGFGLENPEAIRRPAFGPGSSEGLVYLLPRALDGSIVVGICLKSGDMDDRVRKYAMYIG